MAGGNLEVRDWADGKGADLYYGDDLLASIGGAQAMNPADIEIAIQMNPEISPLDFVDGDGDTTRHANGSNSTISGGGGDDFISSGRTFSPGFSRTDTLATMFGGDGNDTLSGLGGRLRYYENGDGATIYEQALHRDTMDGGAGDDLLYSVNGNDLTGGAGAEMFHLNHLVGAQAHGFTFAPSVISDFNPAEDALQIHPATLQPGVALSVVAWADGTGADIFAGGTVIARVTGGQGLTVADISVVAP